MEQTRFQARIVSNNQITIPEEVREIRNLWIGDILTVDIVSVNRRGASIDEGEQEQ